MPRPVTAKDQAFAVVRAAEITEADLSFKLFGLDPLCEERDAVRQQLAEARTALRIAVNAWRSL